jgi:hypothetical protein
MPLPSKMGEQPDEQPLDDLLVMGRRARCHQYLIVQHLVAVSVVGEPRILRIIPSACRAGRSVHRDPRHDSETSLAGRGAGTAVRAVMRPPPAGSYPARRCGGRELWWSADAASRRSVSEAGDTFDIGAGRC